MNEARRVVETRPEQPPEHPLPSGLRAGAVGQVVAYVIAGIGLLVFFHDPTTDNRIKDGLWPIIAQFPLLWAGLFGAVFVAARGRGESIRSLTNFAVRPWDVAFVFLGAALQIVGSLLYSFAGKADDAGKPAEELIGHARNNAFGFFVLAVLVGFGAPLMEELFYRGLVARGFQRLFQRTFQQGSPNGASGRFIVPLSAGLSALWFGVIHLQPLQFPLLFVVGLTCALLMLRLGRLGPAIFVHVGFNLLPVIQLGWDLRSASGLATRF